MTQNAKYFHFRFFVIVKKSSIGFLVRLLIFAFCVITFVPIKILTLAAHQNDRLNLSFVKDEHTYLEKMARIGLNTVIYKGTFVSNQSLVFSYHPGNSSMNSNSPAEVLSKILNTLPCILGP